MKFIDMESSTVVDGVFQLRLKSVGICQKVNHDQNLCMPDLYYLISALDRVPINQSNTVTSSKELSLKQLNIIANAIFQPSTFSTKICLFAKIHQI